MDHSKSQAAFTEAKQYIPGGVNSPVRSFRSVGGVPPVIAKGSGSKLTDIDGNEYIDYVLSYGPLLLGHAHPQVTEAIQTAAAKGSSYGAPTLAETELAKLLCTLVPSMEMVRMVNSGTEATMSALRLARAYTGRESIVKFIGCYHGHHDSLLVKAGSGAATLGVPDSPGVPKGVAAILPPSSWSQLPATWDWYYRRTAIWNSFAPSQKNMEHCLSVMKSCLASAAVKNLLRASTALILISPVWAKLSAAGCR